MSGTSIPEKRQGGLQVVKASQEPGLRWDLDEEALASVLLRPDIRNLPVVVVSVAGVYRGGKSFILGFFLRYLMASKEHQLNGQWLGKDDDLLEDGFNWRVGSDPDTKGIYLWPEPIVINIERTGRKVAVLLMDTQGTFDTESDMGDNSSIFALSVLLSSTQIYNLRANIREDDLQHLQLFTEYGKLATKLDGKAFQTLLFLIRNWQDPDDHSYGYIGGKELLDKKLAPKPNQKAQILEVRKHIHSCFEKLECFLMPYPGNCVTSKKFKGRLGDIDKEFKSALLDLVPALFSQNNLNPKTINGEETQAQGLYVYFKQYAAIFNSNELPPASTIFQATADAAMTSALREACQYYESIMKTKIIKDQSVLTSMIQTWHNTALEAAIAHFNGKKKFSSKKKLIADNLAELKKTSENWLLVYQLQNNEKLRNALSEAQKMYEDTVAVVCEDQAFICLHVLDLEALHNTALIAALNSFDPTRKAVPMEQDTDRNDFINKLEQNYQRLCLMNKRNNSSAELEASKKYLENMTGKGKKEDHEESLKVAIEHFLSHRNQPSEETEDDDLDHLQQEIEGYYKEFNKKNGQKNLMAMNAAECAYKNYVNSEIKGSKSCCFHPLALKKLHDVARDRALEQFQNSRVETEQDDYEDRLIANIEDRYRDLEKLNRLNNIDAVDKAYNEYKRIMEKYLESSYWDWLVLPYLKKKIGTTDQHNTARDEALKLFKGKRREHCYVDDDEHLKSLKQKIEKVYISNYESLFGAIGRKVETAATAVAAQTKEFLSLNVAEKVVTPVVKKVIDYMQRGSNN